MPSLKPIPEAAIPAAIEKALRYRLLNEPLEAESICLDILHADPGNEEALINLLLARTDLFAEEYTAAFERAKAVLPKLTSDYDRAYYEGVVHERWAKAQTARRVPAMSSTAGTCGPCSCFERAEALAPADNPDAILRWNTCARLLDRGAISEAAERSSNRDIDAEFGEEVHSR